MDPSTRLTLTLAASAAGVFVSALILTRVRRWRRRSPEELERLRRLDVNRRGRITTGQIVDLIEPEPGNPGPYLALYKYEITGVTYEVAQDITALPAVWGLARRKIGRTVSVKYDTRVPSNSILACEEWSGVPESENRTTAETPPVRASAEVVKNN